MHTNHRLLAVSTLLALAVPAGAGTSTPPVSAVDASPGAWEKFNDWAIGDVLFPHVNLHGIGGFSTGDPDALATGGHDPRREEFSAQAVEPAVSLRTQYLEGFANYLMFQDASGDWDGELEEAFGKIVNLPGGFEIKAGQFLSRFGAQNDKHLHSWSFVDAEMVLNRFLGDDGLLLRGAEASWTLPLGLDPVFTSIASLGYGEPRPHEHDHAAHAGEEEPLFEGDEAGFADNVWTARLMGRYRFTDFHSLTGGISYAGGENGFGRDSNVAGFDLEFLWRENGLEPGGRALRWRNEFLWRRAQARASDHHDHEEDHDHADEADHEDAHSAEIHTGTFEETGLYSTAVFSWNQHLDIGLRAGWVEGIEEFGQESRFRLSPVATWWVDPGHRIGLRAQYNYDQLENAGDEHSVWFQINIALGSSAEVR